MSNNEDLMDKWLNSYFKLNREDQISLLDELLSEPIKEDYLKEVGLLELLISALEYLEYDRQHEKALKIYNLIKQHNAWIVDSNFYYLDSILIERHLFLSEIDAVRRCMESFVNDPIESIDTLIPLVVKLSYYGHVDIARDVSISVCKEVTDAEGFIQGNEEEFIEIIFMSQWQQVYEQIKAGIEVDLDGIVDFFKKYEFDSEEFCEEIYSLLTTTSMHSQQVMLENYRLDRDNFFRKIMFDFYKRVWDEKGIPFTASSRIWNMALAAFNIDNEPLEHEDNPFDSLFCFNEKEYKLILARAMAFLSRQEADTYALAYGIQYIYDFLYIDGLISEELYKKGLDLIIEMRFAVLQQYKSNAWQNSFVFKWQAPKSADAEQYLKEKEYLYKTFTEKVDVKDYLPTDYLRKLEEWAMQKRKQESSYEVAEPRRVEKIGRNAPCPCGSGKKYKKCCGK